MSEKTAVRTREKWVDDVKVIACILVVLGLGISFAGPIIAAWIMKKTKWLEFFLYSNKVLKTINN